MLCEICQSISFTEEYERQLDNSLELHTSHFRHQPSLEALQASVTRGCHMCTQMYFAFTPREKETMTPRDPLELQLRTRRKQNIDLMMIFCGLERASLFVRWQPLGLLDLEPHLHSSSSTGPPIDNLHTGSCENLALASKWLRLCLTTHSICNRSIATIPSLPTRVVQVGTPNSDPHLVITNGLRSRYATLSHCWGGSLAMTTTTKNMIARSQGIPFESIPKTFQEAVLVTRSLGLEYLWIDALCILQDSRADWEQESFKMGDYYKAAYFTIAAGDATDGSQGCFRDRNPLAFGVCELRIRLPGHESRMGTYLRQSSEHWTLMGSGPLGLTTLERRAWCLQETILSARMINFGRYQMTWTCMQKFDSENISYLDVKLADSNNLCRILMQQGVETFPYCSEEEKESCFTIWLELVEKYCQRALSNSDDMLPAIAGLASHLQRATLSDYLAGIWKDDLARGLLWRPVHLNLSKSASHNQHGPLCFRPSSYRAPSWSWASINAPYISCHAGLVHKPSESETKHLACFGLKAAILAIKGHNPLGQVQSGSLLLQAVLKEARPLNQHHFESESLTAAGGNLVDPATGVPIGIFNADESEWPLGPVWCLPILWRPKKKPEMSAAEDDNSEDDDEGEEDQAIDCLALQGTGAEGEWKRVGLVFVVDFLWFRGCETIDVRII